MLTKGMQIKPVPTDFGPTGEEQLRLYVDTQVRQLIQEWTNFHNDKLPKQRKIYLGTPREETKQFPWPNASNIVVQVVGQHVDTLQARIMTSIYELSPLWPIQILGTWEETEEAEEQRKALEDFQTYCGLSTEELDAYRIENLLCADMLKHGFGVVKTPYERDIEQFRIGVEGGNFVTQTVVKADGPQPVKLPLEDFYATSTAPTLEKAHFKMHKVRLSKFELLDRRSRGFYDSAAVDAILASPDANGPAPDKIEEYRKKGLNINDLNGGEWHLYECWFPYYQNQRKWRIIYTYHLGTGKKLRSVFNFYPENDEPFVAARMGYSEDGLIGRGFAEMLKDYQEEVTVNHNQRVDKRTLANTSLIRVGRNSRFDANFKFYPNAVIPAEANEIEAINLGIQTYPQSTEDELMTLKEAEDRSGVGASTSGGGGLGSGTVGKTSGAYSAMGTMAVMQDNNKRVVANLTDFRYAHQKLGRLWARMYGHFGLNGKEVMMGTRAALLEKALENLIRRRLGFSVKAPTSSINREVEKQNFLLLTSIMQNHYTGIGQLLQAILNPELPPDLKDYMLKVIKGSDQLMMKVLNSFGIDDTSRVLPEPTIVKQTKEQIYGQPATDSNPVAENSPAQQGEPLIPNAPSGIPDISGMA